MLRKLVVSRRTVPWILGLPLGAAALFAAQSCSSTPPPTGQAAGCSIDSDCSGKLICAFGSCHTQCTTSKDCMGETCLLPGVCELPQEKMCSSSLPCVTGLTCANDVCRSACSPTAKSGSSLACLGGQSCVSVPKSPDDVCVDNAADGGTHPGDGGKGDARSDARGGAGDDASEDAEGGEPPEAECPLPESGSGPLGFTPSNFDPLHLTSPDGGGAIPIDAGPDGGGVDWSAAPDVVIDSPCLSTNGTLTPCFGLSPVTITLPSDTGSACYPNCVADLYVLKSLKIVSGGSITVENGYASVPNNPIIIAVRTVAQIAGPFLVTGDPAGNTESFPGPGGFGVGYSSDLGPGAGGNGGTSENPASGAGGGAFCGAGGQGGASSGPPAPPGERYGLPTIVPLQGGSSGGGDPGGNPGAGGGGLQIAAGASILVTSNGIINANGQGCLAGGGAGGAILLEAPTVIIDGVLVANGGPGGVASSGCGAGRGSLNDTPTPGSTGGHGSGGKTINGGAGTVSDAGLGSGGGGAGWIRINTGASCSLTTTLDSGFTFISPSLGSGCASTGKIKY